jgi:ubiquinone biosynthesis monooxygenase Coq7
MSYKHLFAKNYQNTIKSMVRVNFAGELGAIKIYKSQIKVIPENKYLKEMLDSEIVHFEYFRKISQKLYVPQTLLLPVWSRLASFMGFITAKSSFSDAMLCTEAVETVIEKHYQEQITQIEDILQYHNKTDEFIIENKEVVQELLTKIKIFMQEEIEHKNTGNENSTMKIIPFTLIKAVTKLAVILSQRI